MTEAEKQFIYIHGVQPNIKTANIKGYSKKTHERILKHLKRSGKDVSRIKRFEIVWADVTFPFKKGLAAYQFDADFKKGRKRRGGKLGIPKLLRNFVYPVVVDIIFYVKNKGSSEAPGEMIVLERLHKAVKKAKKEGFRKVVIFAHSLGSVAAYDYIFRFRKKYSFPKDMKLSTLITFGSPIGLFASSMGYPMSSKIEKPSYAKKWVNFWDHDDAVAGRCEPHFPEKFVKGFLRDVAVDTAFINPLKAHERYWSDRKVIKQMAEEIVSSSS